MKKLLLTAAAACWLGSAYPQLSWGTQIGKTYYDLHSNASTGNRLVQNPDGSMSATWIEHWGFLTTANEPKTFVRGFGYNHFNAVTGQWEHGDEGECWEDANGCASKFTGWPEMLNLPGSTGNNEMVISHTPLQITSRSVIGTGNWSNTSLMGIDVSEDPDGATWPRTVSSGDYIHMVGVLSGVADDYVDQYGIEFPLRYYRSSDGGQTWDIQGAAFDMVDTIPDTTISPNVVYNTTDSVLSVNPVCTHDTIRSGVFTAGGISFNADTVFSDSTFMAVDTTFTVSSWVDMALSDTAAIVETCVNDTVFYVDTIITYDTTYGTTTYNLINRVGADRYAIYTNGANVAVTVGDGGDNDWLLFKSTDNGDSWSRTIIKNNHNLPVAFIGQDGDGHITNAGDFDIFINDAGEVHVFAGMALTDNTFIYGDAQLYKDLDAGMLYWKEGMNEPVVVARPDYGFDGDTSTYSVSGVENYGVFILGWPAASFDDNGGIYLIYSAAAEGTEFVNPTTQDTIAYHDLYMVYSKDNGNTWMCGHEPISVAEDVYQQPGSTPTQDDLYPITVADMGSSNALHLVWQGDWARPGVALRDDTHPNDQENYIMYAGLDVSTTVDGQCVAPQELLLTGFGSEQGMMTALTLIPNPAKSKVQITTEAGMTSIEVIDMVGKQVLYEEVSGTQHLLDIDQLVEGIYIVKAQTAQGVAMKRLVVE